MTAAMCSGYKAIAATGTDLAISAVSTKVVFLNVIAPLSNKYPIRVGAENVTDDKTADTAGYVLVPGKKLPLGECKPSHVWINGKAGDAIFFVAGIGA